MRLTSWPERQPIIGRVRVSRPGRFFEGAYEERRLKLLLPGDLSFKVGSRKRGEIMIIEKGGRVRKTGLLIAVISLLLILAISVASCGGKNKSTAGKSQGDLKLPPGATKNQSRQSSATSNPQKETSGQSQSATSSQQSTASSPNTSADLSGARFTVVNALRNDSNKKVLASGQREVLENYLEVELAVENIGDELVDLTQYSFRLESPGIAADTYNDYYGNDGLYGKYVSGHIISAILLDYADLKPVDYKLRIAEKLESVFLFFDLNPLNTARNGGVTKDNAKLLIRKVTGSDYGAEVEISLAGYPD
jgi:hypothetical protein